ncbi:hypothetical protein ACD591_15655 [Rufibacter glacialis]|uniref:Exostosin family protein n=1 Tax=Rufibacter glacialis TaxID=1259555 RepID=A0A5M8QTU1_9BACT|nr:hypothetical protein [Rufibacter glacialis]KAA6437612.1 hypothetical protein FOE74_03685 [Rufibacter glacialis]GGK57827.1 hypothetical protein GCM10011405_02380 [Rufibacter glacialis]
MEIYIGNKKSVLEDSGLAEKDYLFKVIQAFQRQLVDPSEYSYVFINGYEGEALNKDLIDRNTILLIFDEQCHDYSFLINRSKVSFQAYISENELKASNHFCIPLGYNYSFRESKVKKISERSINVFFSGNLHKGRSDFFSWLLGFKLPLFVQHRLRKLLNLTFDHKFPSSYIRFTSGFNSGLSSKEYSSIVADSKIVLCPGGSVSVESFRLYEAMRQGCVIISEVLPERKLFNQCPIIEIPDWGVVTSIVENLLSDTKKMEQLSMAVKDWYDNSVSPEAIGRYIYHTVKQA